MSKEIMVTQSYRLPLSAHETFARIAKATGNNRAALTQEVMEGWIASARPMTKIKRATAAAKAKSYSPKPNRRKGDA